MPDQAQLLSGAEDSEQVAAMEIKVAALEALVVDMGAQMTAMQGAHGAQMAAMQARMAALEASMAAPLAGSASCHAVLSSPDLWLVLWPSLDRVSKVALRGVSKGMRSQVDASIKVVASPASGFSPSALSAALVHWHAVHDLKLLAVSGAADLAPLATASLAGLTSLTVRQADPSQVLDVPTFSSSVAAALRVIDVSGCAGIRSVNFICNCEQLRCLWMPGVRVSDLWPLVACSETLEELWLAGSVSVKSLEPLEACNKLRKLDLRHCYHTLYGQVEDLQLCCTQLADPVSVEIEGLVHELQRDIPPSMQAGAAYALGEFCVDGEDTEMQNAIAAAGAIPSLVQLLGRDVSTEVQAAAARAVGVLAGGHAQNQVAIAAAGAIPPLLELLGPASSAGVLAEASDALRSLASNYALNQAAIVASGVIPALVRLLEHADDEHDAHRYVQAAAACAMRALAEGNAQGEAAISAAGGIPALVVLLRPAAWPAAQEAASHILRRLAVNHGQCQVAMVAAGAIPALAKLLERGGGGEEEDEDDDDGLAAVRVAAAYTLCDLAEGNVQRQDAIASAGAILTLAMMLGPESSADAQKAAARALRILAAENAKNQLFIARAGAIPGLVLLLRPESTADLQVAAADALGSLAVDHARNQVDIVAAGAVPPLVQLLGLTRRQACRRQRQMHSTTSPPATCRARSPSPPLVPFRLWCSWWGGPTHRKMCRQQPHAHCATWPETMLPTRPPPMVSFWTWCSCCWMTLPGHTVMCSRPQQMPCATLLQRAHRTLCWCSFGPGGSAGRLANRDLGAAQPVTSRGSSEGANGQCETFLTQRSITST